MVAHRRALENSESLSEIPENHQAFLTGLLRAGVALRCFRRGRRARAGSGYAPTSPDSSDAFMTHRRRAGTCRSRRACPRILRACDPGEPARRSWQRGRRPVRTSRLRSRAVRYQRFESHPLRQSRQSRHSFPCARRRPESHRMRAFPPINPNHGHRPGSPFRTLFGLFPALFSDATEPRPFWYGC